MNRSLSILVVGALLMPTVIVSAQSSLVAWGPSDSYVSTTQSGQRPATSGLIPFDMDTPISPLPANYSGGAFYGGADSSPSMNTGYAVFNNNFWGSDMDTMMFGRTTGVTAGHVVTGVTLWKKEDFINGSGETDEVTVTSFSFTGLVTTWQSTNRAARFVLQQGSDYIISDNIGLDGTFPMPTRTLNDLSSVNWFTYDPVTDFKVIGALVETPTFSGVTAAGLFLTAEATGEEAINLAFTQFGALGTVAIPEPSTTAAMLGAGVLLLIFIRRRFRSSHD